MSRRRFPWSRLGIDETSDSGAIRKAYADALRAMNIDEDVAGYADLRRARDHALWLAAEHRSAAEAGEEEGDDLGLGGKGDDDAAQTDPDWLDVAWDAENALWDDAPPPLRSVPAGPEADPELSAAQAAAQAAWGRLLAILYPGGEPCEDAMSLADMEDGLAALGTLIARAEAADLAEHDALDSALAALFARTWPRAAPFVEPAAEAFHWLDEAGSLEERPALRFLNERLRGMRFHAKVQEPGHPLHKAWVQLSQPGPAGIADRLRVKRNDVDKLLTGIRRNFPELEHHLDSQRVASWDARRAEEGAPGLVPRIIRGIFIVLLVVAVPRLIPQWTGSADDTAPVPIVSSDARLSPAEIDARVAAIFGEGMDLAGVTRADPAFATQLLGAVAASGEAAALDFVRLKALGSADIAPRPALLARAQLKALWMAAAGAASPETCRRMVDGNLADLKLTLGAAEKAREQGLLRQLLAAKVLSHTPKGGEVRYAVPGWLAEAARARSGLSPERLKAALGDPDSPDRCKAEAGLVAAAAAAPDKVPDAVLKGL